MAENSKETAQQFTVTRHTYSVNVFEERYPYPKSEKKTLRRRIAEKCACSKRKLWKIGSAYLPVLKFGRHYMFKQYLLGDILSGLTVSFMHLPQAMGFGILAGLRPVHGLYTTLFPVLIYLIFGTSPYISFGTNAVMALMTQTVIDRETDNYLKKFGSTDVVENVTVSPGPSDEDLLSFKVGASMICCFWAGIFLSAFGLFRLGFLTSYLSVSFVGGFTTAAAVHIATSQVPKMFGIKVGSFSGPGKLILTYIDLFSKIKQTKIAEVIITVICLVTLLVVKICVNERFKDKMKMPIPIDLIVVVLGTIICHFANFSSLWGVKIVGPIPSGLPAPALPPFENAGNYVMDGFVMAVLSLMMTISMAKLMARKHGMDTDDNQELLSYGLCNLISGFFSSFPSATAPPRTMILSNLGAKTTLNAVATVVFFILVLFLIGPLFKSLPLSVLAAMIIVSMKELLLQYRNLPQIWNINKYDFGIWIITNSVGVLVNLDYGIIAGIGVSVLSVVIQSQLTKGYLLKLSNTEDILIPMSQNDSTELLPDVKIFRLSSNLFFATAERFKSQIYSQVLNPQMYHKEVLKRSDSIQDVIGESEDDTEKPIKEPQNGRNARANDAALNVGDNEPYKPQEVIIDCSVMTYIDMAGINILQQVIKEYSNIGISVYLAGVAKRPMETLDYAGFFDKFPKSKVFIDALDVLAIQNKLKRFS